jgi:hypothetical protein
MSSPNPSSKPLSDFTSLHGGFSQSIAGGDRLVTLNGGAGATWWNGDTPVTAVMPPNTAVDGTRWTSDGASLRVGLGTLDLGTGAWRAEPALEAWNRPGPRGELPVRGVAWFADALHVAMLIESTTDDGKRKTEIAVASIADGRERGRRDIAGASALVASGDRVLVLATRPVVLDIEARVVAEPVPMPLSPSRVREGAGMFAVVGAAGVVALVRPADGAVLTSWDGHAIDAVPVPRGVVAVDLDGNVRVGCLEGSAIRVAAEVASGARGAIIQRVGDRIVLAGGGADPVRVARFTSPCR